MNDIGVGSLINYASSYRLSLSSYRGSDLPNVEALEDLQLQDNLVGPFKGFF